jgi:DSF synthase
MSGRVMPASELHAAGLVDIVAPDGGAEAAVQEWIARNARHRNGTQAIFRARNVVQPVTREELDAVAELWVDAAFRLGDKDLRMMGRIVRSQMRRMEHGDVADVAAAALAEEAREMRAAAAV